MSEPPAVRVVRFTQEELTSGAGQTIQRFDRLRDGGDVNLACDLSKVGFASSISIGLLLRGLKRMRESGGDLRLFGLNGMWQGMIEICDLGDTFRIFETEDEAVESFDA